MPRVLFAAGAGFDPATFGLCVRFGCLAILEYPSSGRCTTTASLTLGQEPEPLESLQRVKGKTVLMVVGFALAIYFLIPQLAQTDFGAVLDADWRWAPVILLASFMTYVGAAWNIMGSVPQRVPLITSVFAQFAGIQESSEYSDAWMVVSKWDASLK
jgi:hypothetical protein